MLKNRLFALVSIAAFSFTLAACGDDDDDTADATDNTDIDGGGEIDSGNEIDSGGGSVDDNTPLKDLTPDQLVTLCEENEERFETIIANGQEIYCYVQAFLPGPCVDKDVAACVADIPEDSLDCTAPDPFSEDCTATVGQFLACQDAGFDQTETAVDGINCENAQARIQAASQVPAACAAYNEACPDDSGSGGGKPFRRTARK